MLVILGYSFNQKDNRLEQGGLLQFASKPSGAVVTLDEITMGSLTPGKSTASAQNHTVTMSLKGYRMWQKTINLKPGMIGWLSYARLVPQDPKTEKLRSFATLAANLPAPDNKSIVFTEDFSKATFILADLQNDVTKYRALTLPTGSFTVPTIADAPQTFVVDSWSHDARHLLVKHSYDTDKVEWIVVDIDDIANTKNITAPSALRADKVLFGTGNGQTVFAKADGTVYRIKLDDLTLPRPIIANIDDFSIYSSTTVLYVSRPDPLSKQRTVGYINEDMQNGQSLGTYPDDGQSLKIAMSDYFSKRYLAVGHGATVTVTSGELPRLDRKGNMKPVTKMTLPAPIEWLSMSTNSRFIIAEATGTYITHDLELIKTDVTRIGNATGPVKQLRWLDAYMTYSDKGGMLRLYEFDGANQQNTVPVAEGFNASLGPNDKYIYSIVRDGAGFALQRLKMIVE